MRKILSCLVLLASFLTACGQATESAPDLAAAAAYRTMTSSPTLTLLPALTEIFLPTPTVLTYTVADNDTLSSIAERYGVSLEALQDANPGVQPTALTVGTTLVIPVGGNTVGEPTPTPAALPVAQARCWPEGNGGLWCFALVKNDYAETLENLSLQLTLLDAAGQEVDSQTVYGLLDILPAGASMPLAAHFAPPAPAESSLRAQVLTAIRLLPGDVRYLPVMLENTLVSIEADGHTAQVSGRVLLAGEREATTLWVLATVYDEDGNVIGVRRWDSPSSLTAEQPVAFDFLVSSVGPKIDRVDFLAEARP